MRSVRRATALAFVFAIGCATAAYEPGQGRQGVLVPIVPPAQPVEQLLANLQSSVAITRAAAAWNLAGVSAPGEEVRKALDTALDDPDTKVREAAAWALGHGGADVKSSYDQLPRPLRIGRPTYPRVAFENRLEGTVGVEVLIGEDGKIIHAEVRRSIPGLDEAAVECLKAWSFEPARRKGRPAPAATYAPVSFRMFN